MTALFTTPKAQTQRYQVSLCLGLDHTQVDVADEGVARELLATFADRHAGNSDAHGGIYDRYALKTIGNWWGHSPKLSGEALFMATLGKPYWQALDALRAEGRL